MVVWELMDSEDRVKNLVKAETAKAVDNVASQVAISEARTQQFIVKKLDELADLVRHERVHQDAKVEASVRRIVREELAGKLFTKKVRRSVEDMEAAVKPGTFRTPEEHARFFKAEEARVVFEMKRAGDNINKLKEANRRLRARRLSSEAEGSKARGSETRINAGIEHAQTETNAEIEHAQAGTSAGIEHAQDGTEDILGGVWLEPRGVGVEVENEDEMELDN